MENLYESKIPKLQHFSLLDGIETATLAIELALQSPKLSQRQKLNFVKRKVELMQEFGTIQQYRESCEQLKKFKGSCASELKVETKKRQELEREEMKLKDLEKMIAHTRAMTDLKGKTAESEGKVVGSNPAWDKYFFFNGSRNYCEK